jgi:hypothetical protein
MASIVPSMLFGLFLNQWGSNLIWGSVFGFGWCMAAFATGGLIHNDMAAWVGILWGWLVLVPLFFFSGWLWRRLSPRRRVLAIKLLLLSFLLDLPAKSFMWLDAHHIHFPDYSLHAAESY